jgi:hypothetical protein
MAQSYSGARKGANHHCAKLTEQDVVVIRQRLKEGCFMRALAEEYGVGLTAIFNIKHRHTWREV